MFLIDKPYVSDVFKQTIREFNIPVIGNDAVKLFSLLDGTEVVDEVTAINRIKDSKDFRLYSTSENSIGWISRQLAFSDLPEKIELFKDKFKFRELTKSMFPNFFYKSCHLHDLRNMDFSKIPLPFIIKPCVGFFSMGVYKVTNYQDWLSTVELIIAEMVKVENIYPQEVLDTRFFILEQIIEGEEFAIDAYFNSSGEAVIVGIFKHIFSSDSDVSDRVYITSDKIIQNNLDDFTVFINQIGQLSGVKNFPVHIELRRDKDGSLLPIEINPMRFGGWCTTADLTFKAFGLNPYHFYYSQLKPDWPDVLQHKQGKIFSIIVLDNTTGLSAEQIISFDYEKLLSCFENPIELREIDFKEYPLFGFVFTETRDDNLIELEKILNSDLNEFVLTKTTE